MSGIKLIILQRCRRYSMPRSGQLGRPIYGVGVAVGVFVEVAVAVEVDVIVAVGVMVAVAVAVPVTVGERDGANVAVGGCELRRVMRGAIHSP